MIFTCALARLCTPDAGNYPWALFAIGLPLLLPMPSLVDT